ncbi:glycosyltransferase family 4 protein [Tianweitania sediminis]|uniref:glycosyltransferase family 4 protein n=1 Tax=Tianweitania sediminis TaxID=1502156 RepID=UPI003158E6E3
MKPLLVLATDSLEPSGVGQHMLALGRQLSNRFDVVIAAGNQGEGMALLRQAALCGLRVKALDFQRPSEVTRWLARSGACLIHVHAGIGWEGHELVRCGKAAGLAVVRTEHLPYLLTDPIQKAQYRAMCLSVDQRIAVSQSVLDTHAGQGSGPMALVHNGVAPRGGDAADAKAVRATIAVREHEKLLLTVARLTAQKGHDVLLAAAPAVLAAHPAARFVLVGRGSEQVNIEEAIERAGLQNSIQVLGQRDDVEALLAAADLFVLPSRFEGLPLALLEAMSAGLPIAATAVAGTLEALGLQHPFLARADDPAALAAVIIKALDQPDEAQQAAKAARQRYLSRFTDDGMAAETAAVYADVLSAQSRQGMPQ